MLKTPKVRREDLAPGGCLCDHCTGKCCRYFSLPVATPTTPDDYDAIGAYLDSSEALVYVEKGTWYAVVMTRCHFLTRENRCRIYLNRPKVCQEYTTADCEYDTDWTFERVFETADQLRDYVELQSPPPRRPRGRRTGPPVRLPEHIEGRVLLTFALETPKTRDDYDAIRWYLAHERTVVYVHDKSWHLAVLRRRSPANSRADSDPAQPASGHPENVFETSEQLWEYAEMVLPAPRRPKRRVAAVTVG
jgi:Fe-S-cluster containining protein